MKLRMEISSLDGSEYDLIGDHLNEGFAKAGDGKICPSLTLLLLYR